jgi:two-component system phosphate regulon sensor histidine kinase PhoR
MYGAATDVQETRSARDELELRVEERTRDLADALEAVRRNEQRLRLLLEQMPATLWTTDRGLRVTALVGAAVPGFDSGAPSGQDIAELFADAAVTGGVTALHETVLAGTPAEFEFQVDSHTYEGYIEPLRDAEEGIVGTIGVAHDVSDRTLRKLQEAFIASVSHELQTPLTSIRAGLGMLEAGAADTLGPAERELLAASRRNVERLRVQIAQLLAANQIVAGSTPQADRTAIDLYEVVTDAVEAIRPVAQEKEQVVQVDLPRPLFVSGDRRLLDQVLTNLLTNAHRHTPPGTQIAVSAWFVGDDVRLAVHDTGPGVPADQLHAIFERFYRGATRGGEGAGLGLAIARSAVEAQGGRIWAESIPGQGTTFFVSLPRAWDAAVP